MRLVAGPSPNSQANRVWPHFEIFDRPYRWEIRFPPLLSKHIICNLVYVINNIPEIISYVVYGYVFLVAYYWISFKDNKDFNNLLIRNIATSYLLTSIYDLFVEKYNIAFINEYYKVIYYFAISAILGFAIGKIISHRRFNLLLHKLHIGRTTNENIGNDIIKPYTWISVFMKDDSSYLEQY